MLAGFEPRSLISTSNDFTNSSVDTICCLLSTVGMFKFEIVRKPPFLYNLLVGRRTLSSGLVTQQCQQVSHNLKSNHVVPPPLLFMMNYSCSTISDCQIIHTRMIKSGDYNVGFIGDRLVALYAKSGNVADAFNLFDELPEKDLVSWNSMIAVFSRRGDVTESFKVFCRMRMEMGIQPNEVTLLSLLPVCADMQAFNEGRCIHNYAVKLGFLSETKVVNSLINMYGKCLSVDSACQLFEEMPFKNLVSWNSMIAVHTRNGLMEEATNLFNSMRMDGVKPDRATILTLLQASADLAAAKQGKAIHGFVVSSGFSSDVPIVTTLINVYSKSGSLDSSLQVFLEMKYPDKIAWTAMVAGYAVHGQGREAIRVFNLMVSHGVNPDHVTFTHLLCACSHSGLIEEGKKYFHAMYKVYGVEPRVDHYSCMVDLLGRSGLLDEARQLIETMPIEPNAGVWGALLGACRVHRNIELGKEIAERLFRLDQSDPRNYVILSNMYSAAGLWRNASNVRALMKERGLRKDPGCSFIEHGGKVYRFVVGDQSHPESEKIYSKLEELITKMQKAGYVSKTEFVLHDVDEEVKEDMISKHSEKLAIAFGLLVMTNTDLPILITKNLRICGDCHNAAKFISLIEKRRLVIRDSKRFHHFVDGLCSCGDYW